MDNKKKNNIKVSRWVVLTLFFVVSVALLTYFYPREGRSLYVFHEGRPWSYSLLTAPFDFPIYKDDDLIRREQDSILVTFKPIYRIDDTIGKTMVARFDSVLMHYPAIPIGAAYRKAYCDTLKSIYDAGIVSAECYTALQTGQIPGIRVLQNNLAKNYPTQKLLSPKAAYERFLDAYPDTYSRHILQSTGLNDFLVENILPDSVTTQKVRDEYLQQISLSQGMVQAGERIVDRGEIVTPEIYRILKSYEMVLAKKTATDAPSKQGDRIHHAACRGSFDSGIYCDTLQFQCNIPYTVCHYTYHNGDVLRLTCRAVCTPCYCHYLLVCRSCTFAFLLLATHCRYGSYRQS